MGSDKSFFRVGLHTSVMAGNEPLSLGLKVAFC